MGSMQRNTFTFSSLMARGEGGWRFHRHEAEDLERVRDHHARWHRGL
jgi:hypothetical protein